MLFRLLLLFAAAGCVTSFTPDVFLLRKLSTLVLLGMGLALLMYFNEHIIDRGLRIHLVVVACMICVWMLLRGAKYIAFEESETVARHLWYAYYVPAMLVPQISVYAALTVGRGFGESRAEKTAAVLTTIVTFALMATILTNDVHQLVFRFKPGFADWDWDYTRAPLFFIAYAWIYLLFGVMLAVLFRRCRLSESRKLIWIPVIPVACGLIYQILYILGLWPKVSGSSFNEAPEAVCFAMAGVWLSFIYIGLIPSNEGYGELFSVSRLSAQIADGDLKVVYRSEGASDLERDQLAAEGPILLGPDTRLHRKAVRGGFVYWQDDISELNRILGELTELGEKLSEEAELLRLENELKEDMTSIEAKTRIYDGISARTAKQSRLIESLCGEAEKDPSAFGKNMAEVCVAAVYIKRYANLSLLSAGGGSMSSDELFLAIEESLRSLESAGVAALAVKKSSFDIDAEAALGAYELFENVVEAALQGLKGISAVLSRRELRLSLEGAGETDFSFLTDWPEVSVSLEDGDTYIRISIDGGEGRG